MLISLDRNGFSSNSAWLRNALSRNQGQFKQKSSTIRVIKNNFKKHIQQQSSKSKENFKATNHTNQANHKQAITLSSSGESYQWKE
jgi:hypothetical protein